MSRAKTQIQKAVTQYANQLRPPYRVTGHTPILCAILPIFFISPLRADVTAGEQTYAKAHEISALQP